jgi:hypothetical protein
MQRIAQPQTVVADFFFQGYRVSGAFAGGDRALPDVIYDPTTDYLLIRDAYLSPITTPAAIGAHYASTMLAKQNLDFVLTLEQKEGLRRDQRYAMGNYAFDLCLIVPFFEVRGRLHSQNRSFDPRVFLSGSVGAFVTLLDVTARCTFDPDTNYQGGAAIVNRTAISFIGEQSNATEESS